MNWDAIGAVGEIVGGAAVIFSILYLAFQIRESRVQALAQSQRELLDTSKFYVPIATTPDAVSVMRQGLNDYGSLDADTQGRFHHIFHPIVNHVESVYHMKKQGLIDEETYDGWMAGINSVINTEGGKVWWSDVQGVFVPGFVAELDRMRNESERLYKLTDAMPFLKKQNSDAS